MVEIRNTEARISEPVNNIDQRLESARLDRSAAEKLRGRFGVTKNNVLGRTGALALKTLTQRTHAPTFVSGLSHVTSLSSEDAKRSCKSAGAEGLFSIRLPIARLC